MNGRSRARTRVELGRPLCVLQQASAAGKTTKVTFHTPAGVAAVWLCNGRLVDASLGRLEAERALTQVVAYDAARWFEEPGGMSERQVLHISLSELKGKVEARQRQWVGLLARLPPLSAVLTALPHVTGVEGARGTVLSLIDGRRRLFEVLDESGLDPVAALSSLAQLLEAGAVCSSEPAALPEQEPPEHDATGDDAALLALQTPEAEPPSGAVRLLAHRSVQDEAPSEPSVAAGKGAQIVHSGSEHGHKAALARAAPREAVSANAGGVRTTVGRYEILGRLGRGGMATVYLCRVQGEGGFSRRFAMKVLREHLCKNPDAVQMLLREACLTGRLHHPNVVSVLDVGSNRRQPYLVMEYVPGCSVAELIAAEAAGRLTITAGAAATIVVEALAGLHAAHTLGDDHGRLLGLVHQDVSPDNLLVGFDGVTRVTDFGVAHVSDTLGSTAQDRGKPQYLAPERITTGEIDHRADIFAMGVVLYRLLTGLDLFEGETTDEITQDVLYQPILPPSSVGRHPHPAFDAVCLRALERTRDQRYQTAEHFRADLLKTAVLIDQLGLSSDVAELARRAVEVLRPGSTTEPARETQEGPGRAIVLARPRTNQEPRPNVKETEVLVTPRGARPLPAWAVAIFLTLSLGIALALDALSDSGPEPPPVPPNATRQDPVLETLDIRVRLEDDDALDEPGDVDDAEDALEETSSEGDD